MSAQERILLVRLSHLGDVVHALPVFHALRVAWPDACIAWAVQREFASLLQGLPGLDRVLLFERRGGARAWLQLREELAAFDATLAVDAQGNLKSALATLASGAPRRIGLACGDWREPLGCAVLTERAPRAARPGDEIHAMDRMAALARHVAGLAPGAATRIDPALSAAEQERGREQLARLAPPGSGSLVVLQLARSTDVRSWPLERFEQLARALAADGRRVLVLSGPEEEREGLQLQRSLAGDRRVAHWVGQRGLRQLASLWAAAAAEGARFVGCDSGPLHLAVACGLPVVALAGPQDPRRTGPWPVPVQAGGPQPAAKSSVHRVVRAADAPPCAPCQARACAHPEGPVCMTRIEADAVLAALAAGG